ncbi:MAG: hypothetical protein QM737_23850 [Ferruginibacter sp.]
MPRRCSRASSSPFLYLIYIIGWAMINPKIAPTLPEEQTTRAGAGMDAASSQALYSHNMFVGADQGAVLAAQRAGDSRSTASR